jgi:hypothetical protein
LIPHFIRGYFDGDGSAYGADEVPTLSFCGPAAFLVTMAEWIEKNTGEQGRIINHYASQQVRYLE